MDTPDLVVFLPKQALLPRVCVLFGTAHKQQYSCQVIKIRGSFRELTKGREINKAEVKLTCSLTG